ncbi:GtrA family protein [Clostridium paridis]|uniref:GtrA family protein n=1 Tax=Clostridium paridis TaxID=2803863 RepID=A0A937FJ33_9CLOT|nr:GtrA family protein [Clostridium paridis]MBL4932611.1 GtrA family protein [Clostridium paridis]
MKNKAMGKQFGKYLLVGGSTALLELLLYTFFRKIIYLDLSISNIAAVFIATVFNFIINRGWAFKNSSNIYRSIVLYIILFIANTTFSTNAIVFMVRLGVLDIIAKFITMCMITLWNFILYRKVIFK